MERVGHRLAPTEMPPETSVRRRTDEGTTATQDLTSGAGISPLLPPRIIMKTILRANRLSDGQMCSANVRPNKRQIA